MSKPHWLSPAGKTTTPPVVISFDTETIEVDEIDHTVQRLRCWDAIVRIRRERGYHEAKAKHHAGETASSLCDLVETTARGERETWVIAHNLSFDLAVTSLPFILVSRGWEIVGLHLGDESSWWVLRSDGHRVVITDSWSWLRCSLSDAAHDIGRRKIGLPKPDDTLREWHRRCRHDAEILDEIIDIVMTWWTENDLGSFGITGAACGWRSLRRKIPPRRLLVGPDPRRTDYERRAVFGGRREVWGVGDFIDTWIGDWDMNGAYPTVCAAYPLPLGPCEKWSTNARLLDDPVPERKDYIAEVEITTRVPCAPCRIDGQIFYPVGTFRTVLTGPEVRYVLEIAESVRVISHKTYRLGFAIAEWASWLLSIQYAPAGTVPEPVRRVAKGWGRSVVGRFSARSSRVIDTRPSTHLEWHLESGHDLDTGVKLDYLSIGGVEQVIAKDQDSADVFPAVLAFVEAHTRVALGRIISAQDPRTLLQCNTDGFLVLRDDRRSTYRPPGVPWPFVVSRKALERRVTVKGPNHLLMPHDRRYSGVPESATETEEGRFMWYDWPGLRWQLEHGKQGEYHRVSRGVVMSDHYVRRWVLASGETIPITTEVDQSGKTIALPWSKTWGRRWGDYLAPAQVEIVEALRDSDLEQDFDLRVELPIQPGRDLVVRPNVEWSGGPRDAPVIMVDPTHAEPPPTLLAQN